MNKYLFLLLILTLSLKAGGTAYSNAFSGTVDTPGGPIEITILTGDADMSAKTIASTLIINFGGLEVEYPYTASITKTDRANQPIAGQTAFTFHSEVDPQTEDYYWEFKKGSGLEKPKTCLFMVDQNGHTSQVAELEETFYPY